MIAPSIEPVTAYALATPLIFAVSAIALPLTGMEHSWHVLTAVLVLEGLVGAAEGEAPGAVFVGALILMPLIRFEGFAFAGARSSRSGRWGTAAPRWRLLSR